MGGRSARENGVAICILKCRWRARRPLGQHPGYGVQGARPTCRPCLGGCICECTNVRKLVAPELGLK
eukprot:14769530-Alexandrium_andersonii.AAC.1